MLINIWGRLSYFLSDFSLFLILIVLALIVSFFAIRKIYNSGLSESTKNICLLFVFTFLVTVLTYSGFEAYFRYKFDESDSLGFLKVTGRWFGRHVSYNNFQYRDHDFSPKKPPGQVRIGVMGDSNAFGYGIKDYRDRFSNILEKKLKKNGYNVEVNNFGQSGIDTKGEIGEYNRIKHLNFDLLVWQYFLNDVEEGTRSAGTKILQNAQKQPPGLLGFLLDNSYFFNYLYWRLSAKYNATFINLRNSDMNAYHTPEIFKEHKQLIASFSGELKDDNKKFVVIIIPFLKFLPYYPAGNIHRRMIRIFKKNGAFKVIDMLDYLKGRQGKNLVVGRYDTHPNEKAHTLMADKLYDAVTPLLEKRDGKTSVKGSKK